MCTRSLVVFWCLINSLFRKLLFFCIATHVIGLFMYFRFFGRFKKKAKNVSFHCYGQYFYIWRGFLGGGGGGGGIIYFCMCVYTYLSVFLTDYKSASVAGTIHFLLHVLLLRNVQTLKPAIERERMRTSYHEAVCRKKLNLERSRQNSSPSLDGLVQ